MRQFVAVAEELHFGRAAARLNMAQPPLSQAIRRLELSLGVDLFNRSKRNVELSAAGEVFLIEARRTLLQAEVARKMAQSAASETPEVRISFIGPALYQVLPEILVRFRAAVPKVHARLFEVTTPQQIDGILAGDYHVGFITHGIRHAGCESKLVERSGFVAAVPANSPLAASRVDQSCRACRTALHHAAAQIFRAVRNAEPVQGGRAWCRRSSRRRARPAPA